MDTSLLDAAYRDLLETAARVDRHEGGPAAPPAGQWNADQILAHVSLVTATTISAVASVAAGYHPTYDNRIASDTWTIDHVVSLAGGGAGLRERIRRQADALCALDSLALAKAELDTPVPTRLVSNSVLLVDAPTSLRDLLTGLAETELPGHADQLLDLLSRVDD